MHADVNGAPKVGATQMAPQDSPVRNARGDQSRPVPPIVVWSAFVLINVVLLFCLLNPWVTDWRGEASLVLVVEAVLGVVAFVPIFLYHLVREHKSVGQSATDTIDNLMDFLAGWA